MGQLEQGIVVDHNSVELFDSIPQQYKEAASKMNMLFMDRSVGGNIDEYLNCLASPGTLPEAFVKNMSTKGFNLFNLPSSILEMVSGIKQLEI